MLPESFPMKVSKSVLSAEQLPRFDRDLFGSKETFTCIGSGAIGGKASGLAFVKDSLAAGSEAGRFENIVVNIPILTVLATDIFDGFMKQNDLFEIAYSDMPDDRIAHAFQKADFPVACVGDLRGLIEKVHTPLAIRSSSLLEDAIYHPFAGVYGTKMIPNNQPDADTRFKKLVEAIKFVYASTFFKGAKDYIRITGRSITEEKMAVVVQEVVGKRFGDRYYPHISGVARSYNFYPFGHARPDDGVVVLAVGLGKTIVEGGQTWAYSPDYPQVGPPFGSIRDMVKQTQSEFWAVNMGKPPAYDPIRETEYLVKGNLGDAEMDGTLQYSASTYQPQNDRIVTGVGSPGPRVVNFAPLLRLNEIPFNDLIKGLLELCEEAVGSEVETEFALTLDSRSEPAARLGFLQVRPMVVSHGQVEVTEEDMTDRRTLVASEAVMGNGCLDSIVDVVYLIPERFSAKDSQAMVGELEAINREIVSAGRPYVLIGFGRWGSSDPWLGVPVNWGQICGAKVMVEATLPDMNVELSQGSHFFHNITSFGVFCFSVRYDGDYRIDWDWLARQKVVRETEHVRHIGLPSPLLIKVDGRSRRGVIRS
jgi:hypothetical protein